MLRAVPILLGKEEVLHAVKEEELQLSCSCIHSPHPLLLLSLQLAHVSQSTGRVHPGPHLKLTL